MPEMIDKAKLLEYLAAIKPDEYVSAYGEAAVDVINHVETYVSEMPTIEAEPVRHGRWSVKVLDIGGGDKIRMLQCSKCSRNANMKSDFCPNCGALMDGGADNG